MQKLTPDAGRDAQSKMAFSVKVGEKGQIVIPKEVRKLFGLENGDNLLMFVDKERGIAIPPKDQFASLHNMVFGQSKEGKNE